MPRRSRSVYVTLAMVIVLPVVLILGGHEVYDYQITKKRVDSEIKQAAQTSIMVLENNVADDIAAYALNEYLALVENEMARQNTFAIVIEDLAMGRLIGEEAFVSGRIRDENWQIVDYDPANATQRQALADCYYAYRHDIVDSENRQLGSITIYISDHELRATLAELVRHNINYVTSVSLLLTMTLFYAIRRRLLDPLDKLVRAIGEQDSEGIPQANVNVDGPTEIRVLSATLNKMLNTIRTSRQQLRQQKEQLENEQERFQLAIEGTRDGLWDWDMQTDALYHSPRFETMLGYEVGELPQTIEAWSGLLHPDDRQQALQTVNDYINSRGTTIYENTYRMLTKSGEWRWITGRGRALFDENGKPLRFLGFNSDTTDFVEQREALHEQKSILEHQASHDALTGLANRTLFNDRLEMGIEKAKRRNKKLAILFIDLDHFKEINDSLGHKMGDQVLTVVTRRLQDTIRAEDTLARLGGDEFTILLENMTYTQDASRLADKVLSTIKQPIVIDQHEMLVGSSIGISIYPDNGINAYELMRNADADAAMYKAKNQGRNNYQYYSAEMTVQAFQRLHMETSLRNAINKQEFVVHYQPQIDQANKRMVGIEALLRWETGAMGLVMPEQFRPVAESTGLIIEIDRLMLKTVMQQTARWYQDGLNPGVVSLNLNFALLRKTDFVASLEALSEETGCQLNWLELAVTETQLMDHPKAAIDALRGVASLGVKLALDDFGIGHSSLSYLKKFPVKRLKIDKTFIHDLPDNQEDAAIAKAFIALANSLGLDIVVEDSQNQAQVEFLQNQGCRYFQGDYFAAPMTPEQMQEYLSRLQGRNIIDLQQKN